MLDQIMHRKDFLRLCAMLAGTILLSGVTIKGKAASRTAATANAYGNAPYGGKPHA